MAIAKVFESKKAAYLLHKQGAKQSSAGAKVTSRTVNQQAYWNHVSKYLKDQGGRGGIKEAADSWANSGSASAAKKTAKGKAAKAKAKAKAESKSAKATKAKASAAKQQEPKAKQTKIGVTKTIQDKEKAKKEQKKAKADKVWTAFRASATK